jgi:hypothetical protein
MVMPGGYVYGQISMVDAELDRAVVRCDGQERGECGPMDMLYPATARLHHLRPASDNAYVVAEEDFGPFLYGILLKISSDYGEEVAIELVRQWRVDTLLTGWSATSRDDAQGRFEIALVRAVPRPVVPFYDFSFYDLELRRVHPDDLRIDRHLGDLALFQGDRPGDAGQGWLPDEVRSHPSHPGAIARTSSHRLTPASGRAYERLVGKLSRKARFWGIFWGLITYKRHIRRPVR